MNMQREIYDAVVKRGYRDGWTAEQFAARQLAKLTEELGELSRCVHMLWAFESGFEIELRSAAKQARAAFDGPGWENAWIESPLGALDELADIVVVACCLAEALGETRPDLGVDLPELALAKAKADVIRGVRQ